MSSTSRAHRSGPARLLLATRSEGKLRELRHLLGERGVRVVSLEDAGIPETEGEASLETAATFEENALLKARHFFAITRFPTIADDSGLEVDALEGAPGVRSKRWSGRRDLSGQELDDENNALLLRRLAGARDRRARYVCAAAYCDGRLELVERGEVPGVILERPRGSGGFGYDPYFQSDELGQTFAEVSVERKASVSHRARAFARLLARLRLTDLR